MAHRDLLTILPEEVLDRIISYVVYSPNHAGTGVLPKESYRALFRPQVIHVNRRLRSCALAQIARDVLWIKIRCDTARIDEHMETFGLKPPQLPKIWASCLPKDLPSLTVSFPNNDSKLCHPNDILIPFNFNTLAYLFRHIIQRCCSMHNMDFEYHANSPAHSQIIRDQVKPLYKLLYFDSMEESPTGLICRPNGINDDWSSGARADELLQVVQDLDAKGCKLEATLLCLHRHFVVAANSAISPEVGALKDWLSASSALERDDWQTNPANLERMRIIRTMWYLEYRAFLGWAEAQKTFRNSKIMAPDQFDPSQMSGSLLRWPFGIESPEVTFGRWIGIDNNIFGLLNCEMAQVAHARALVFQLLLKYWDEDVYGEFFDRMNAEYRTMFYAACAWYLSPYNEVYSSLLRSIMETASEKQLRDLRARCVYWVEYWESNDGAWVHPWNTWTDDVWVQDMTENAMGRSFWLSINAEIRFEDRYEKEDRTDWAKLFQRFTNPEGLGDHPCCKFCDEFELNIHLLESNARDPYAEEVADWSSSCWRSLFAEKDLRAKHE